MDNYLALILSAFIRNGLLEVTFTNLYLTLFFKNFLGVQTRSGAEMC
jgi:hypothetical protein